MNESTTFYWFTKAFSPDLNYTKRLVLKLDCRYATIKMKYLPIAVILFLSCFTAIADSWLPPKVKEYYSSDSSYYVRVVPREVPEKYWDWVEASPKKKKKFS